MWRISNLLNLPARLGQTCFVVLLGFSLCWPAYLNGQAFFFADTTTYFRGAAAGFQKITGYESAWTVKNGDFFKENNSISDAQQKLENYELKVTQKNPIKGRSVYYGAFLLVLTEFCSLWSVIIIQGMIAALAVCLFMLSAIPQKSARSMWLTGVLLLACTGLPFYSSLLMPDVFAGVCLMLAAMILSHVHFEKTTICVFCFILSFGALAHTTVLLLIAGLLFFTILKDIAFENYRTKKVLFNWGVVFIAVVVGIAGDALFSYQVKKMTGLSPVRPPFLMARLIGDGAGKNWIRQHCAQSDLVICRYSAVALNSTDLDFVWSDDPRRGVFYVADVRTQQLLADQEMDFVVQVIKAYPVDVGKSFAGNFLAQLQKFGLIEFNYSPDLQRYRDRLPATLFSEMQKTLAAHDDFPSKKLFTIHVLTIVVAVFFSAGFVFFFKRSKSKYLRDIFIIFVVGVLLNSLICGGLSMPADRYQVRLIWVFVPLSVACMWWMLRSRVKSFYGNSEI